MIRRFNKKVFVVIGVLGVLSMPFFASAEGYVNLVGIPGLDVNQQDFQEVLNTVFRIAIIAAALIAVIKLILAGVKYVMSGLVSDKNDAKADIQSALIGLLIILSAVLLLRTINPDIVNLPVLPEIDIDIAPMPPIARCDSGEELRRYTNGTTRCIPINPSSPVEDFENQIPDNQVEIFPTDFRISDLAYNDPAVTLCGINAGNFNNYVMSITSTNDYDFGDVVAKYITETDRAPGDSEYNPALDFRATYVDEVLVPACELRGGNQVRFTPSQHATWNTNGIIYFYCINTQDLTCEEADE